MIQRLQINIETEVTEHTAKYFLETPDGSLPFNIVQAVIKDLYTYLVENYIESDNQDVIDLNDMVRKTKKKKLTAKQMITKGLKNKKNTGKN